MELLKKDPREIVEGLLRDETNDFKVGDTVFTKQYGRKGIVKSLEGCIIEVELDANEANADIGSANGGLRHFHFAALRH
jgi:hypothetical protein